MLKITGYINIDMLKEGKDTNYYRAKRESDQKLVILKTGKTNAPSLKIASQLLHEYNILKKLFSEGEIPSILSVMEIIYQNDQPILIFDDTGNQLLRAYVADQPMELDNFFPVALQLVNTIRIIHSNRIIHKDIKPDNIIIDTTDLSIKLMGFNIATRISQNTTNEEIQFDSLEGTLAYMSPEQTGRLNRSVDYRSDFYSLGVTFYEMLTGYLPFQKKDPLDLIYCHLAETPPPIYLINPKVPPQLAAIISKLMGKMPEERYMSSAGIRADLETCYEQWKTNQQIEFFPLAQHDISERLNISHKLYGREEQKEQLLHIFDRVKERSKELVLLSGRYGIGVKSLVEDLYKPRLILQGYFASGSFNQQQGATPYGAFQEALEELMHRILMINPEKKEDLRQELLTELGENAHLIIDMIPSLELIIGPQPQALPLSTAPLERDRLIVTFKKFIGVFAKKDNPLVLFINNGQWIDNESIIFIKAIAADPSINHLLIVLSYRYDGLPETTMPETFSIDYIMGNLKAPNFKVRQIELPPLTKLDIQHLLADTLNHQIDDVDQFASILVEKTKGNPFFINEFLKTLNQNGLLFLENEQWKWDLNRIRQQTYTDNVIDILLKRLQKLPASAQDILRVAACVGYTFDAPILATITKQPIQDIMAQLDIAIEENFITPLTETYKYIDSLFDVQMLASIAKKPIHQIVSQLSNSLAENLSVLSHEGVEEGENEEVRYRFTHDKIHQATYELMGHQERKEMHLLIGRLLRDHPDTFNPNQYLINITNHLNEGIDLINEPLERRQLIDLNLKAGERSKNSNAYEAALNYFEKSTQLLPPDSWDHNYETTFKIFFELATCQFLNRQFENADKLFSFLIEKAETDRDRIKLYLAETQCYLSQPNYEAAIKAAQNALHLVSYDIPLKPTFLIFLKEKLKLYSLLHQKTHEQILNMPDIEDEKLLMILKTLNHILLAAALSDYFLFAIITLKITNITLRYGNSPYGCNGLLAYASLFLKNQFDQSKKAEDKALSFYDLTSKIMTKYKNREEKITFNQYAGLVFHFRRHHIRECLPLFHQSYNLSKESQDLTSAAYTMGLIENVLFLCGEAIPKLLHTVQNALQNMDVSSGREELGYLTIIKQFHETLLDETGHPHEWTFENDTEKKLGTYPLDKTLIKLPVLYHNRRGFYHYLMGEPKNALRHFETLDDILQQKKNPATTFLWINYYFYYPLTLLSRCRKMPQNEWHKYLNKINDFLVLLKSKSEKNPENHLNKYLLVRAELARLNQDTTSAIQDYIISIKAAKEYGFVHEEAIAHELLGGLLLEMGDPESAKAHIITAYHKFTIWGSQAKTTQMEKMYSDLLQRDKVDFTDQPMTKSKATTLDTLEFSDKSIDIASILKASQAVSSEIELDKLLDKLLAVIMENAGAQRVVLLKRDGDSWGIEAEETQLIKKQYTIKSKTINPEQDIPLSLVEYAQRTKKPLIIKDSEEEYPNTEDPYLKMRKPKSILILPIIYKDEINNIVYLENNAMTGSFTKHHIQTLQFIASQAAISLKNAMLYQQATHDPMTGLANRNLLHSTFFNSARQALLNKKLLGVVFLDLDFFKRINDTLGHEVGDEILIYFASVITNCIRKGDLAVRLGGDEFVVLLDGIDNAQNIQDFADKFYRLLAPPFKTKGQDISLSSSVGISIFPTDGTDIDTLLKKADIALYKVKESGKNHYRFYEESFEDKTEKK